MPRYQTAKRFACPCCGQNWLDPRLEALVKKIENETGHELEITSGFRCEKHNKKVGGSETSSHLTGLAVDVAIDASRTRYVVVGAAIRLGINRIGVGPNYLHLDIARHKAPRVIWVYK